MQKTSQIIVGENNLPVGCLVLVDNWVLDDQNLLQKITNWRNRFKRMFPTQKETTVETTSCFIKNIIDSQKSQIHLIVDSNQTVIGHIGIAQNAASEFELVHLMRGEQSECSEIVYYAERTLLSWCFKVCQATRIDVEVMSYNFPAITVHQRFGFKKQNRFNLRKEEVEGGCQHTKVSLANSNVDYCIEKWSLTFDESIFKNLFAIN